MEKDELTKILDSDTLAITIKDEDDEDDEDIELSPQHKKELMKKWGNKEDPVS